MREQQHPARGLPAERGAIVQFARRDDEQGSTLRRVRDAADPVRPACLLDEDQLEEGVPVQAHAVQHVAPVKALQLDGQRIRGLRHEGMDGRGLLQPGLSNPGVSALRQGMGCTRRLPRPTMPTKGEANPGAYGTRTKSPAR